MTLTKKRGPKPKVKLALALDGLGMSGDGTVLTPEQKMDRVLDAQEKYRNQIIWQLSAEMLQTRARATVNVNAAAIKEIADQAKRLYDEVYGPF